MVEGVEGVEVWFREVEGGLEKLREVKGG